MSTQYLCKTGDAHPIFLETAELCTQDILNSRNPFTGFLESVEAGTLIFAKIGSGSVEC